MKKILLVLILAIAGLLLAGCGTTIGIESNATPQISSVLVVYRASYLSGDNLTLASVGSANPLTLSLSTTCQMKDANANVIGSATYKGTIQTSSVVGDKVLTKSSGSIPAGTSYATCSAPTGTTSTGANVTLTLR